MLCYNSLRIMERARQDGVDVQLTLSEGMSHVCPIFADVLKKA